MDYSKRRVQGCKQCNDFSTPPLPARRQGETGHEGPTRSLYVCALLKPLGPMVCPPVRGRNSYVRTFV